MLNLSAEVKAMSETTMSYEDRRAAELAEKIERRGAFEAMLKAAADAVTIDHDMPENGWDRGYGRYELTFTAPDGFTFRAMSWFDRQEPAGKFEVYLIADHLPGYTEAGGYREAEPGRFFKTELNKWASEDEREQNAAKPKRAIYISTAKSAEQVRADVMRRLLPVARDWYAAVAARIAEVLESKQKAQTFRAAISEALGVPCLPDELHGRSTQGRKQDFAGSYPDSVRASVEIHRENAVITIDLNCGSTWDSYNKNWGGEPGLSVADAATLAFKIKMALLSATAE